jgi:MFS family permease
MVFWGQIQNYMMRVNISIAIVEMVKPYSDSNSSSVTDSHCNITLSNGDFNSATYNETFVKNNTKFDWSPTMQGFVLGAFYYGYVLTQIIGGRLAEKYGTKKIYGGGLFMTAVITFLLPLAAKLSVHLFIVLRAFQGVCEGVTFPSLHAMTARWIPPLERSSFISRSYFGTVLGTLFTFPMCSAMMESFGWESSFYLVGSITLIWFIFWCLLVFDTPETHPRISTEEKGRIMKALSDSAVSKKAFSVPWRSIFTSVPFIGLLFSDIGNTWGLSTLLKYTPTYMKSVQCVDLKTNGLISGLPFGMRWLGAVILSYIADFVLKRDYMTKTIVRRLFYTFAMIGPAVALCMVAFSPDTLKNNTTYITMLLCAGLFFNGGFCASVLCSYIEMAPNYAGTLLGICNMGSSIVAFIVPMVVGQVLENRSLKLDQQWQIIFMVPSALYVLSNITYIITVTSSIQPWNSKRRNYTISMNSISTPKCTPKLKHKNSPGNNDKETFI